MNECQERLIPIIANHIQNHKGKIVVLTGAGISTNSGIPDFRSSEGTYSSRNEDILSRATLFTKPHEFYEAFNSRFQTSYGAKPNNAHRILAEMEQAGYIKGIVTQNIDGLHQAAGSQNVIEYHGTGKLFELHARDEKHYGYYKVEDQVSLEQVLDSQTKTIRAFVDDKLVVPKVVLFGGKLFETENANQLANSCTLGLVIGTRLEVFPFASLINNVMLQKEGRLVILNNEKVPMQYEKYVSQCIGDCEETLTKLWKTLEQKHHF